MRKQYDDFTQMKMKDMCKAISDMTFHFINPNTNEPTKVPPAHYEKILDQVKEQFIGEITSKQFLNIMYSQIGALKKEDPKYFKQALLCHEMGINPKDMRPNEEIALIYTYNYMEDKEKLEKKNFHLLNQDIVSTFNDAKENPIIQASAIRTSNELDDKDNDEIDFDY